MDIASQTDFPWLMSNVRDKSTGRLLAEGQESHILDWEGRKVCVLLLLCAHSEILTMQVEREGV